MLATMRDVLQRLGFDITSEGRTPEHNRQAGGVPNSWHLHGRALDVWNSNPKKRRRLMDVVNRYTSYKALDEGDHVHIEPKR